MEAFLEQVLPKILEQRATFTVHAHNGKASLLHKLSDRLRGYARWLPPNYRIIVVIDRDGDDCKAIKQHLEASAAAAGLSTRSVTACCWQVANRIAVEELEAWFFAEWRAVRQAYPNVARNIPAKQQFRNSDSIAGGTWEAFERILKRAGYFSSGYRKVEAARSIGQHFDTKACSSKSFQLLRDTIIEATTSVPFERVARSPTTCSRF